MKFDCTGDDNFWRPVLTNFRKLFLKNVSNGATKRERIKKKEGKQL